MNEIFDKLLIRIGFTLLICASLLLYKYAHIFLYPSHKQQALKRLYPCQNEIDTLNIFGRLVGIAIVYTSLEFNQYVGFLISTFHILVWGALSIVLYLASIWSIDAIVLSSFDYKDEVLKKRNFSYGLVSFSLSISLALMLRNVFLQAENSLIILLILWVFSLVLYGLLTKTFRFLSPLSFNLMMVQAHMGIGTSFSGFLLGLGVLIASCFEGTHPDIITYMVQVILKIIICIFTFPIFRKGIISIFKVQGEQTDKTKLGYGIYEGCVFFISGLLSSIVVSRINLDEIYSFF